MKSVFYQRSRPAVLLENCRTVISEWYSKVCLPQVFGEFDSEHPRSGVRGILFYPETAPTHTADRTMDYLTTSRIQMQIFSMW